MATTAEVSNHHKYQQIIGNIDFSTDVHKIILMNDTYVFDPDTDSTLSGITADQLPTANGYTQDDFILQNISITQDDTNDRVHITWDNPSWTVTSGTIGPTGSSIVYNDTTSDKTVVGAITFERDYTVGQTLEIQDIVFNLN